MSSVGLIGGTFNPIHHGHLFLAGEAMHAFRLDKVLFIPNYQPPHRRDRLETSEHRHRLVELATSSNPAFEPCRVELERQAVSYTVDTVAELRLRDPRAAYTFVTGADALMKYPWKELDRLLGMLERFVVATRPGFSLDQLAQGLDSMGLENRDRIVALRIPQLEISSTEIRRRVATGRPIRYLVPEPVLEYIQRHDLYLEDPVG
ncbi:MAG: nicotinate-nucleotide adenylyltransferase [Armatimonadetes bacterium]|nr:nicotinate-nucleotide adenylyltransferase [Armatimonadota bacterium]